MRVCRQRCTRLEKVEKFFKETRQLAVYVKIGDYEDSSI
jgi:hypothetical protein